MYSKTITKPILQKVKMSEFITQPLLITEYYDSLISQLDIYTEEKTKEYKEKGLPEKRINDICACGGSFVCVDKKIIYLS